MVETHGEVRAIEGEEFERVEGAELEGLGVESLVVALRMEADFAKRRAVPREVLRDSAGIKR